MSKRTPLLPEPIEELTAGQTIVRVKLSDIYDDPANTRRHPERNLRVITASLKDHGQVEPLLIQKRSGRVIGGNGRLTAMMDMGWTEADVVYLDVDDLTATRLSIQLNRSAELAEWEDSLGQTLAALQAEEIDLGAIGFDDGELEALLVSIDETSTTADEEAETPFSTFNDGTIEDGYVVFRFGDYAGKVGKPVYDAFVTQYKRNQTDSAEPMLDDVLRHWLGV